MEEEEDEGEEEENLRVIQDLLWLLASSFAYMVSKIHFADLESLIVSKHVEVSIV